MNPFRFKIPRRSRTCQSCEKMLVAPMSVQSLIRGEEDEPIREDYCIDCFDEKNLPKEAWGHWTFELKLKQQVLSFDQRAMELFKEKLEQEDQASSLFLAEYLTRKKQLIYRREIKKEGYLFYEDPQSEELFMLKALKPSFFQLKELKDQLVEQFNLPLAP